jgi:hypothetical protein
MKDRPWSAACEIWCVAWSTRVLDFVVLCLHGLHEGNICFRVVDAEVLVRRVDMLQGFVLGGGRLQDRRMWRVNKDETT